MTNILDNWEEELNRYGQDCDPAPLVNALLKAQKEKTMDECVEIVKGRLEQAEDSFAQSSKLSHNSYGAGVDWGMREMCNYILEDLEEAQNLILNPTQND